MWNLRYAFLTSRLHPYITKADRFWKFSAKYFHSFILAFVWHIIVTSHAYPNISGCLFAHPEIATRALVAEELGNVAN